MVVVVLGVLGVLGVLVEWQDQVEWQEAGNPVQVLQGTFLEEGAG